jgi:cyclopropane-fatty-acyl-phospholipid synthase
MLNLLIDITERGLVPDPLMRIGIRRLCGERLTSLEVNDRRDPNAGRQYVTMLKQSPVAIETQAANQQHYELPADFFLRTLGHHLKYSCAYWPEGCLSLKEAERAALEITMERAELKDGMKILELGCGWGSLSLAMAEKFPGARITAVSNSASQREFIEAQARLRNFKNLEILTRDVATLEDLGPGREGFDRVVSVEMFEHLRNYEVVLGRIRRWLAPTGKLFIHIFTHQKYPYLFETEGSHNWMGKYFFTGGQMPSQNLLASFQKDLSLEKTWQWDGTHYQKTSEAWLANLNSNKREIMELLEKVYGADEAGRWFQRWKLFFMAVAELFGYRAGTEWGVTHYLFSKGSL